MKIGYIYKITSPSGRVYIGSTIDINRRKKDYKNLKRTYQWKIKNSLNKYGFENHLFEIIWTGSSEERLKKEAEYGIFFNVLDRKIGLNLKLSTIDGKSYVFSEETINKMKCARIGKSAFWNNKKISLYDLNGNYIKTFNSTLECAKELNCSRCIITSIIGKRIRLFKNIYQIKKGESKENIGIPFLKKERSDKNKSRFKNMKKIRCIEDDLIFNSISEAANYYNLLITTISNILNGRAKKSRTKKSFCYI